MEMTNSLIQKLTTRQLSKDTKPMRLWLSITLFAVPSVVLILATRTVMPWLNGRFGLMPVLCWFAAGGILVFMPLFFFALTCCRIENRTWNFNAIKKRLRLYPMSGTDWKWTAAGLGLSFAGMGLIFGASILLSKLTGTVRPLSTEVPFLEYHGLERSQYRVLLFWLVFFFFNIFGEELLWRGYILPRQELNHGKYAWAINGLLWTVFHTAFGSGLITMMIPIFFILPYIVQKRKNTLIGIWIHAIFNGPIFVLISLRII